MVKLSRAVVYALQATLVLAEIRSQGPIPCTRIASAGGMPERFLLQILRSLVEHGILDSSRGQEGGYCLGRRLHDISLLDLIEAVDGPIQAPVRVGQGLSQPVQERVDKGLVDLTAKSRKLLESIRLSSFIPAHSHS